MWYEQSSDLALGVDFAQPQRPKAQTDREGEGELCEGRQQNESSGISVKAVIAEDPTMAVSESGAALISPPLEELGSSIPSASAGDSPVGSGCPPEGNGAAANRPLKGSNPEDPLADVLDWLGKTRYDVRQGLPIAPEGTPADDATLGDVSEECVTRGAPPQQAGPRTSPQAQTTRHLTPKLERHAPSAAAPRTLSRNSPPPWPDAGLDREASKPPLDQGGSSSSSSVSRGLCKACSIEGCFTLCGYQPTDTKSRGDYMDDEEEEWNMRQRKSGTVGRLVVYNSGERPREDVVLRGGGGRQHIVVAGVREGGQAARAGVRAGDRLVSIDGRKDFQGLSADAVRDSLRSPTLLVFLGFVGKLQAEVRLTNSDHLCGISVKREVCRGSADAPVQVCEQTTFNAGLASLFLTVDRPLSSRPPAARSGSNRPLFELQRSEASGLIRRALRRVEMPEGPEVKQQQALPDRGVAPPRVTSSQSPLTASAESTPAPPLPSGNPNGVHHPTRNFEGGQVEGGNFTPMFAMDQHMGFEPNQRMSSHV
eukprot:CAMPEP_0206565874 /NCGR_PEP_ID=MMETSP0325_2-20121206/24341_1 /ASSEMBLY_ACC=CAM_ASM_000347 /TAXON_ID=2866 /ORGANISM="Crypthecodinium cohnii, Strain Seligo" /LENGTH=537 /DNA_ID=CAMNT_0054068833 /DNA_START=3 /DNA_END=1616 /DNA_ORIENTATION=+